MHKTAQHRTASGITDFIRILFFILSLSLFNRFKGYYEGYERDFTTLGYSSELEMKELNVRFELREKSLENVCDIFNVLCIN